MSLLPDEQQAGDEISRFEIEHTWNGSFVFTTTSWLLRAIP
jgi:hypothetical protein